MTPAKQRLKTFMATPAKTEMRSELSSEWQEGLGGHDEEKHISLCNGECDRCLFRKHRVEWTKTVGRWVMDELDMTKGKYGIGCAFCKRSKGLAKLGTTNSKFATCDIRSSRRTPLSLQRLVKHSQSPGHLAAESLVEHGAYADDRRCPTREQWKSVYQHTLAGKATSKLGVHGVGKRKKVRKMQFCLAEGKRNKVRKRLKEARCIAISQDKRATRCLMRYRCCSARLKSHKGLLSLTREVGSPGCMGADHLRKATLRGIEAACTPLKGPYTQGPQPKVDEELFKQVVQKIECFSADGAAEEQLAGRELASGLMFAGPSVPELRGTLCQSLPNLKVCHDITVCGNCDMILRMHL